MGNACECNLPQGSFQSQCSLLVEADIWCHQACPLFQHQGSKYKKRRVHKLANNTVLLQYTSTLEAVDSLKQLQFYHLNRIGFAVAIVKQEKSFSVLSRTSQDSGLDKNSIWEVVGPRKIIVSQNDILRFGRIRYRVSFIGGEEQTLPSLRSLRNGEAVKYQPGMEMIKLERLATDSNEVEQTIEVSLAARKTIRVGKGEGCGIQLFHDMSISPIQAEFSIQNYLLFVRDFGSKFGTLRLVTDPIVLEFPHSDLPNDPKPYQVDNTVLYLSVVPDQDAKKSLPTEAQAEEFEKLCDEVLERHTLLAPRSLITE